MTLSEPELAERVREACRERAAALTVEPRSFDPDRPAALADPVPAKPSAVGAVVPKRTRRFVAVAAAATVLVGLGLFARPDQPTRDGVEVVAQAADPAGPSTVLVSVPADDPLGLSLESVRWGADAQYGPTTGAQLFGTDDGGKLLILMHPPVAGATFGDDDALLVRGRRAVASPSRVMSDVSTTLTWADADAFMEARYVGLDTDEAITAIDSLDQRSGEQRTGFEPSPGTGVTLLGEARPGSSEGQFWAWLGYRDHPTSVAVGQDRQLLVSSASAASGGATTTIRYLETWLIGDQDQDRVVTSYDPAFGSLSVVWPDGRSVALDAHGTDISRAELAEVLEAMVRVDEADLEVLRERVEDDRARRPVLGSVEMRSGRLELRGERSPQVLCLVVDGARKCTDEIDAPPTGGSFRIGDEWFVVAIADHAMVLWPEGFVPSREAGRAPLPAETATIGERHVLLATPPSDLEHVEIVANHQGRALHRPTG